MDLEDLRKINSSISPKFKIWERTNEDLDSLFKNVNFEDKNVLSVLASTDQVLASYYYGAKNVDTFDRNIIALYYYYLRKWCFTNLRDKYPSFYNINRLLSMINAIYPTNNLEAEAKRFWTFVLNNDFEHSELFENSYCSLNGKYITEENLENTFNKRLSFQHADMCTKLNFRKKYDIIILSNMIEYLNGDKKALITVRNNLKRLASDDCIIICSLMLHKYSSDLVSLEKDIFRSDGIILNKRYKAYDKVCSGPRTLGYSYKLKKN